MRRGVLPNKKVLFRIVIERTGLFESKVDRVVADVRTWADNHHQALRNVLNEVNPQTGRLRVIAHMITKVRGMNRHTKVAEWTTHWRQNNGQEDVAPEAREDRRRVAG